MDMSAIGSSSNAFEDHELLGANYDQALKAHAPFLDICSSSAMPPCIKSVPYKQDVYNEKYIT